MRSIGWSGTVLASLILGLAQGGLAADPKGVATSIEEADADFAYQGEYAGMLAGIGHVGLQVIAQGNGKFDAVLLRGGLPGAGWDRQSRQPLKGERTEGTIALQGEGLRISLLGSQALVSTVEGTRVGELRKIQRTSPTLGMNPPANATVLFANGQPNELDGAKISPEGFLEVGATTKMPVEDFRLHLEFKTPYQPTARGQGRGNSGVYIQRRYEVQILDSFGLEGAFNECGSLYRQTPPDIHMALPPLTWQTYDIWFTAARFDEEGKKSENARITVWHNGVPVHDNREIPSKTGAGQAETAKPLPIHFQNHSNPVHFRNLWIVLGPQIHPAEQPPVQEHPMVQISVCCRPCVSYCCRPRLFQRIFRRCR